MTDFQAEYMAGAAAPSVHVHCLARLGSATDRRVLGRFEADALQSAADNRLSAIVAAYEDAANQALGEIAASAAAALNQKLDSPLPSANR